MELRNLAWHRKEIVRIVNQKTGTPDADFKGSSNAPFEKIDAALNEARVHERNLAIIHGSSKAFEKTVQKTWPASQVTLSLPSHIDRESVFGLWDVTDSSAGYALKVVRREVNGRIFWHDNLTLQWATTGPASATTIEIGYQAEAEPLTEPAQECSVFPYNHRHLLNWSAAVILTDIADQRPPDRWLQRLDEYRSAFHLAISRGSPAASSVPRIRNHRMGGR